MEGAAATAVLTEDWVGCFWGQRRAAGAPGRAWREELGGEAGEGHVQPRSSAGELCAVAGGGGVVSQGLSERGGFGEVSLNKAFRFGNNIWFQRRKTG